MYYLKQLGAEMQKLLSSGMFELDANYNLYLKSHINFATAKGILKGTYKGNLLGLLGLARMKMEDTTFEHVHNFAINRDLCWTWDSNIAKMPDQASICHDYYYHYQLFYLVCGKSYINNWSGSEYGRIFEELLGTSFEKRHQILIERFLKYTGKASHDLRVLNRN